MADQIRGLSSMATKGLLADLSVALWRDRALPVSFESAGGVEVLRNIRAGAAADLVVLGRKAMLDLDAAGVLEPGTLRALFVSDVVAAVPDDVASVSLSTEDDLRTALTNAGRIAYSTGQSGDALVALLERWQLVEVVADRLVQVAPGKSVGSVLAAGDADLGFQQRSEFSGIAGARVLGALPGEAASRSTFSGAVLARSTHVETAREVLEFMHSKEAEQYVHAAGMAIA
jgi:molybdate transport system substrate-binding protein